MKLPAGAVEGFSAKPDPACPAVLFYGPDGGKVREYARKTVISAAGSLDDPFCVATLTGQQLAADPARLNDEAAAIPLTGEMRVVWISGTTETNAGTIASYLEQPVPGALVIVECGELMPRSKLRQSFEKHPKAAAAACYLDDERDLERLIRETVKADGLNIDEEALEFLVGRLGGDRRITRMELEKLTLYQGEGKIDVDTALEIVGDSADLTLDNLVYAIADGDVAEGLRCLDRFFAEKGPGHSIAVLRAALRHFQRLHRVSIAIDHGQRVEQAMNVLRPKPFFKLAPRFQMQASNWRTAWLGAAVARLNEAEIDCKSTNMPQEAICARTLIELARAGARQNRSRGSTGYQARQARG